MTMKYVIIPSLILLITGCGGGGDNSNSGEISADQGQQNLIVEREFTFNGNENISISPVQLKRSVSGVGCEVSGSITNVSPNTCDNVFVEFNATDRSGIIISQTLDSVTSLPGNTGALFSAVFPTGSQLDQCDDIDDIQLEITDYCS